MIYRILRFFQRYPSFVYFTFFVLLIVIYVSPADYLEAFIDFLKAYWFRYSK